MNQRTKRGFGLVLAAAMVLSTLPGGNADAAKAPKLNSKKITLAVKGKKKLKVKNTKKKVKWSIKKGKGVITLKKKKKTHVTVVGKKAGTATVLAKVAGKKLTCKVTVKADQTSTDSSDTKASAPASATTTASENPSAAASGVPSAVPSPSASDTASEVPSEEGTTAPETTVPGTAAPETAAPETAAPETEVPETAAPETAAPETAAPETAASETAAPSDPDFIAPLTEDPDASDPARFVYDGLDTDWIDQNIDPTKPVIAFTFDDGPVGTADTKTSTIIQNALKEAGAHATFFLIGRNMQSDDGRAEVERIKEYGFECGNHSYSYNSLYKWEEDEVEEAYGDTNALLTEITGYSNFLFRSPNLETSETMRSVITSPFVHCSVDSKDWAGATTEEIIENVKQVKDGDIVLMHETEPNTAEAVPTLLAWCKEQDIQVVSVSELFYIKNRSLLNGKQYQSVVTFN